MAYRNPAFLSRHFAAEAGVGAITSSATAAGQGVARLIDYALSANMKFNAAAANQFVELDFGAAQSLSRLIIPPGHNLAGASYEVKRGDSSPPAITAASGAFAAGLNDISWTEISRQFWRLTITTSGQWEFGELFFGRYQQTATGVAHAWKAPWLTPVVRRELPTREAILVEAPARRRFELSHEGLSSGDLAIYDELLMVGVGAPFWFYPTDDAIAGPLFMLLEDDGDREQDHPAPQVAVNYQVKLALREQTS